MSEISERYRRVAATFTERVRSVPVDGAWENPAPCDGWVARDVVRHLIEWVPGFLSLELPEGPSDDDDPARAWEVVSDTLQSMLDDPSAAVREYDLYPGRFSFENAVDMFITGDVLVHTWDLARASGQDESLDADEVHRMFVGMEPMDELLRTSGHYGPRVEVPPDADEQTKLIAFTGRRP
jgi:uncharacterized protein (TIGR03086 family)